MNPPRQSRPILSRARRRRSGAFTLLEVVLCVAVLVLMVAATHSVTSIAARASATSTSTTGATLDVQAAMTVIDGELRYALTVTELTSTNNAAAITFTVPDRTGDGSPDTVRYSWAGAGTPLQRTFNGGTPVDLIPALQEFTLARDARVEPNPQTWTYGPETLLWSYDSNANLLTQTITSTAWLGQSFSPTLPANATAWSITRVKFQARAHNSSAGQTNVQLRTTDSSKLPASTVIQQVTLLESSLTSNYAWTQVNFSGVTGLAPGQTLAFVFKWISDNESADVLIQGSNANGGAGTAIFGTDSAGWTSQAGKDVLLYIYGAVQTPDPPTSRSFLTGLRVIARPGTDKRTKTAARVQVLNQPEITGL